MSADAMTETAEKLISYCRAHKEAQGLAELYDPDAVSVEAMEMPGSGSAEIRGVDAIRGKHDWWNANFEVNEQTVEGPFPHGDDRFAVIFEMDTTNKQSGERQTMKEVAVYTVDGRGKIVREEFYYPH